jgi:hypothetical protein
MSLKALNAQDPRKLASLCTAADTSAVMNACLGA